MTKQMTIVVIGALRVKAPITTVADNILIFFQKIGFDISCKLSPKDKWEKYFKMRSAEIFTAHEKVPSQLQQTTF